MKRFRVRWRTLVSLGLMVWLQTASAFAEVPAPVREGLFYVHDLVAQKGDAGLVQPYRYPSINAQGTVAFTGQYAGDDGVLRENIFTWNREPDSEPSSVLRTLFNRNLNLPSTGADPTQTFGPDVVINDHDKVLVRRYLRATVQIGFPFGSILTAPLTYLEAWDATKENASRAEQVIMGSAGSPAGLTVFLNPLYAGTGLLGSGTPETTNIPSPFDGNSLFTIAHGFAWMNNLDQRIFDAVHDNAINLVTKPSTTFLLADTGGVIVKARLADNGVFLYHRPGTVELRLLPYNFDFNGLQTIATPAQFTATSATPALSDDGHLAAFVGDEVGGLGRGLYLATDFGGRAFTTPLRIAGLAGNGMLDPGETFRDLNGNGQFDPQIGEADEGEFTDFDLDSPLGVEWFKRVSSSTCRVTFVATRLVADESGGRQPVRGIYTLEMDLADTAHPVKRVGTVVKLGDEVALGDGSTALAGTVNDFAIYDPVNKNGEVAFWVSTDSTQAILHARPAELDLIDYSSPLFRLSSSMIDDFERLQFEGTRVAGLVADGTTRILIRTPLYDKPGMVFFHVGTLETNSGREEEVGQLQNALNPREIGNSLAVRLQESEAQPGKYRAFALLRAPQDFVRTGTPYEASDANRRVSDPRRLKVAAVYSPDDGDSERLEGELTLHRPPVILLHGLHDRGESWNWSLQRSRRFLVTTPSYDGGAAFEVNAPRIKEFIDEALLPLQSRGIAATKVDIFGHSMGGVLARLYTTGITGQDYLREENYFEGDFHKLVLVNSPQWGSQVAPMMVTLSNVETYTGLAARLIARYKDGERRCLDCGAVRDLRPDSQILQQINAIGVKVPVHAIYGVGGDTAESPSGYGSDKRSNYDYGARALGYPRPFLPSDLLFGENDSVVNELSAKAGLPEVATTRTEGGEALHFPTINEYPNGASATRAVELLNTPLKSPVFADGLPTRFVSPLLPILDQPAPAELSPLDERLLVESLPAGSPGLLALLASDPTMIAPGAHLQLKVSTMGGLVVSQILVIGSTGAVQAPTLGTAFSADVPTDLHGDFSFLVLGQVGPNRWVHGPELKFWVQAADDPTELKFDRSESQLFSYDEPVTVQVRGKYPDGVWRDVSDHRFGTTYVSSRPAVATVDADGTIMPLTGGRTVITAHNGALTATLTVTVQQASRPGMANAKLANLTVDAGTLAPEFAPETTGYSVIVPLATARITVTPTAANPGAKVKVDGAIVAAGAASGPIDLTASATVVNIVVTAPDGHTAKTYTLTVKQLPTDAKVPVVTVTKPGATVSGEAGNATPASGTASDNVGVEQVLVSLNDGAGVPATLTRSAQASKPIKWDLPITPENGPNKLVVKALDASGNTSASKTVRFRYVVTRKELAGLYTGLATPTANATDAATQVGMASVSLLSTGAWTGSLRLGGSTAAISLGGTFGNGGGARFTVKGVTVSTFEIKRANLPSLLLTLDLDVSASTQRITGSLIENGVVVSTLELNRSLFTAAKHPVAPLTNVPATVLNPLTDNGAYTGIFQALPATNGGLTIEKYPQGDGWTFVTVKPSGIVQFSGKLADGQKVMYSGYLTKDHAVPFYLAPYGGRGSLSGMLRFRDLANQSDLDGSGLRWFKPVSPTDTSYRDGWPGGIRVDFTGSKFVSPKRAGSPLAGQTLLGLAPPATATLTLTSVGLAASSTNQLSLSEKNVVTVTDPATGAAQLKVALAANGMITGSWVNSPGAKPTAFAGVLLQKTHAGRGYFMVPPAGVSVSSPKLSGALLIVAP